MTQIQGRRSRVMMVLATLWIMVIVPATGILLAPPQGSGVDLYSAFALLMLIAMLVFVGYLWLSLAKPFLEISEHGIRYRMVVPRSSHTFSWNEIREVAIYPSTGNEASLVVLTTTPGLRRATTSKSIPMRSIPVASIQLLEEFRRFSPESLPINLIPDGQE